MNKEQQAELTRLAFEGAREKARRLIEMFPDLLPDLNTWAQAQHPQRRLTTTLRKQLAAAAHGDDATSSNGSKRGQRAWTDAQRKEFAERARGRKWSAAQRKKFLKTMRARRKQEATQ